MYLAPKMKPPELKGFHLKLVEKSNKRFDESVENLDADHEI